MSTTPLQSAFEYLEQLPGNQLKRLYEQPSTALAIFRRMLPQLAKTFVMAMLYMHDAFPVSELEAWVRPDSKREQDQALELLDRLNIIATIQTSGRQRAYRLSQPFLTSLRNALTGGGDHRSFGVPSDAPEEEKPNIGFLDEFAKAQWEGILYFIVGNAGPGGSGASKISDGSKILLEEGGFVEINARAATITQTGFTFLLQEVNAQVWSLLIVYLANAGTRAMDNIEVLAFLFTLGSLEIGQDYSTSNLSATQLQMLVDLHDLGIVYHASADAPRFYPTRLATTLNSDSNALATVQSAGGVSGSLGIGGTGASDQKGFIIIETNYRIYAYTNSPLRMSILSLFADLINRFPNMVTGRLSKRSIQRAIAAGITSQQIVSYLAAHAHPVMNAQSRSANPNSTSFNQSQPSLPPTVVDQIRLWQIEGDRMKATTGFLFKEFINQQQYEECLRYAEEIGVLVWKDERKGYFFVTRHEQIAGLLKRQAARRNETQKTNGVAR